MAQQPAETRVAPGEAVSEGPSPEAVARQITHGWKEWDCSLATGHAGSQLCFDCAVIVPMLNCLMEAAKRSAHLEDARAGCEFCGEPDVYGPVMFRNEAVRWMHVTSGGSEFQCERPEVWDALSLSTPKGTK